MAIFVRDKHKRILVCWARRNIRQTLERSRKELRGWFLYFSFVFVFCICISLGLVSPDKGMGVLGRHTPTHQPFSKRRPTCASNNARQCLGWRIKIFWFEGPLLLCIHYNPSLCSTGESNPLQCLWMSYSGGWAFYSMCSNHRLASCCVLSTHYRNKRRGRRT